MKTVRTYVFMFIPILVEQGANTGVATDFRASSNGSSPPDQRSDETFAPASAAAPGSRNAGATQSSVLDLVRR